MTDSYLLLTPLLVLGVLGLIRFIGCDRVFGLEGRMPAPTITDVIPGNRHVVLRWTYPAGGAESFKVLYRTEMEVPYSGEVEVLVTDDSRTRFMAPVPGLANGTKYVFVVNGTKGDKTSGNSAKVSATPDPGFVRDTMPLGPGLRNDIQGVVGMAITIGQDDVVVTHLGRIYFPGIPNDPRFPPNTQSHVVKIVDAANGMDVGSPVTIQMPGDTDNDYAFEALDQPARLLAFQRYYVVSEERDSGDFWYDLPNQSTTTNVALLTSGVSKRFEQPDFSAFGGVNRMYGPVNFRY